MDDRTAKADNGLEIIEASYRLLADASAFDDVIASWINRISSIGGEPRAQIADPLLLHHLEHVTRLFEDVAPRLDCDQVARATVADSRPSVVLAGTGSLIALNGAAERAWGASPGDAPLFAWIDGASRAGFELVRTSAGNGAESKHAILRTHDVQGDPLMAEAFVLPTRDAAEQLIVVRALALGWTDEVATTLSKAFDLSGAEVDICRLLLERRDTALVAEERSTSVHTVRTQLRTVFSKTGTSTQVDLIRLLAMLCASVEPSEDNSARRWLDPLGRERSFVDRHGRRIAYSWMGDPDGWPALLCHGMASTYLLPPAAVALLRERGIRLMLISRPAFGNSDPAPGVDPLDAAADAVCALAEHLGVERWPAIGHSAGFPPLVHAAADPRSRLSGIVGVAAYIPYPVEETFDEFPAARRIAFRLARSSRLLADLVGRFCVRMAQTRNDEFVSGYMYSDCAADRQALESLYCKRMIPLARRFMTTHAHHAIAADIRMMAMDWSEALRHCPVPIDLLHGEDDPVNRVGDVRAWAAELASIRLTGFDQCGELLAAAHPEALIEAVSALTRGEQ